MQMTGTQYQTTKDDYRMQIKWNAKTTEWFQRASEYTGFHDKLAAILMTCLRDCCSVADLGCGAGMIDFKLADSMEQVTCIDREPVVTHLLQKEVMRRQVGNMKVLTADLNQLETQLPDAGQGELWDAAIMLFVNAETVDIRQLLHYVKDKLIIVERGGCINNPYVGERAKKEHSLLPFINHLFSQGIRAHVTDYTLEYGQPITSRKEAWEYVEFYHRNKCNETVEHYLEQNLVQTGDNTYPWYLPHPKHFGVFEIRKSENKMNL
jgi:cyclopropane fatty-acyl-phospholipid synthase-like methyltransferase